MKNLQIDEQNQIKGGYIKAIWAGIVAALGFAFGRDAKEVWDEGWDDPYGRD